MSCRGLLYAAALAGAAAAAPAPAAGPSAPGPLGDAAWGRDPASGRSWTAAALAARAASGAPADEVTAATRRVLQAAQQTLGEGVSAAAELHLQGVVASDPRHRESADALKTLPDVYDWSMCARIAAPPLADQCLDKARAAALAWASSYRPTGDPINEGSFAPLLLSIDLLGPVVSPDERARLLSWSAGLAAAGDALSASWGPGNSRRVNNWTAWRLLIRGLVAEISGDEKLKAETRALASAFVAANILDDGSTVDFHDRDSLHYHVYDLTPLVELTLYAPELVDAAAGARIGKALAFLRPFYTGEQRHVEFERTTVSFDVVRRDAGDPAFANAPWDPASARGLLRLAVVAYPETSAWAGDVADPHYSPMIKQLAALHAGS